MAQTPNYQTQDPREGKTYLGGKWVTIGERFLAVELQGSTIGDDTRQIMLGTRTAAEQEIADTVFDDIQGWIGSKDEQALALLEDVLQSANANVEILGTVLNALRHPASRKPMELQKYVRKMFSRRNEVLRFVQQKLKAARGKQPQLVGYTTEEVA